MARDKIQARIEVVYDDKGIVQVTDTLRELFLELTVQEMREDGWDGTLFAEDIYSFVFVRDGKLPYSIEEIDAWLKEDGKE